MPSTKLITKPSPTANSVHGKNRAIWSITRVPLETIEVPKSPCNSCPMYSMYCDSGARVRVEMELTGGAGVRILIGEALLVHQIFDVDIDGITGHQPNEKKGERDHCPDGHERLHEHAHRVIAIDASSGIQNVETKVGAAVTSLWTVGILSCH